MRRSSDMTLVWTREPSGDLRAVLPDASATLELGARVASCARPGFKLYLSGDLGTGKTTLVRGLLRALGCNEPVRSPTFTVVELYELSSLYLYHYDFYRFKSPDEWGDAGFREQFSSAAMCVVEWPEKAEGRLPPPDLAIHLEHAERGRVAHLSARTASGVRCLHGWAQ
jgi:tRNA threonylcarbamoyladenosine biosynthesis protein TsaE